MRRALLVGVLIVSACGKKEEGGSAAQPATAPAFASDAGRTVASAAVVADAAPVAATPGAPAPSLDMEDLEAVESVAAHCEGAGCDPKRKARGKLAAAAPPFLAAMILDSGPEAMEDAGYLFVQTGKGWFVGEFIWSLEEGELQHRVKRVEVAQYIPGGSPELVIELEKRFLDSEEGPVMQRDQKVLVVCAVGPAGAPSCVDPKEPLVIASRAEDATWRVEVTARPDGTLDRKAVEGKPPADAIGPVRFAAP